MADCRGLLYHIVDNCDYRGGNGKSDSYARVLACNHKRDDEDVQAAYSTNPEARWNQDGGKDWEELALASAEEKLKMMPVMMEATRESLDLFIESMV
jgi:hypothetical protein